MAVRNKFRFTVKKHEWWLIVGIATFPMLLFYFEDWLNNVYNAENPFSVRQYLVGVTYSFANTFVLYLGTSFIFQWLSFYYPWHKNVVARLWREVAAVLVFACTFQIILVTLFHYLKADFLAELTPSIYLSNILFGNSITLITLGIFEGVYLFKRWKESLLRETHLREENTKSQLLNLQAQLDPHFMFNSLNVLSALIQKNPEEAQHFIDHFAKVYRYVLEVKGEMVVTLKQELDFTEAYLNLQKIRFGEGLHIHKSIEAEDLNKFLPPLALQELLSNALKHNEISLEKPLTLSINSRNNWLEVKNNLQTRNELKDGTKTGLSNLKKRYNLLSDLSPEFKINGQEYTARLPLILQDED